MEIKLTKQFQNKLESILISQDYKVRFEKGNFKSGYCIINKNKIVIINKYFTIEGKINSLIEIINKINIQEKKCTNDQIKLIKKLKIKFLGTGTSQGIPVIGCECFVCKSKKKEDKRLRSSAILQISKKNILIDTGPDLRQQSLKITLTESIMFFIPMLTVIMYLE